MRHDVIQVNASTQKGEPPVSPFRPRLRQLPTLLLVLGAIAAGSAREASAAQEFHFERTFTLSQAGLQDFDAFGTFWFFDRGQFRLDVSGAIRDDGSCFVTATGAGDGSGLNYKTGTGASLSVLFVESVECQIDPSDGTIHARVPFSVDLFGDDMGSLLGHMSLVISSSGVDIAGVTLGNDGDN
jgi:hypothetical protein